MPGIEFYGPGRHGYPGRAAGGGGAGFQSPYYGYKTPPSGGRLPPVLDLPRESFRQLAEGPLGRGMTPNRLASTALAEMPRPMSVPWDKIAKPLAREFSVGALFARAAPIINVALLAWELYGLWQWYNSMSETHWNLTGYTKTCDTGEGGGPVSSAWAFPCGAYGFYPPVDQGAPSPGDLTIGFNLPPGVLTSPVNLVDGTQTWVRDWDAPAETPYLAPLSYPVQDFDADPLNWPQQYANAYAAASIAASMKQSGYAAPHGYSLNDPLTRVRVGTQAWFRQFPENAGLTYTWPDVAGSYGRRPPIRTKPVRVKDSIPRNVNLRRRTKERKAGGLGRILLAEVVTEGCDAVEALFKALPEFRQREAKDPSHPGNATDARRRYRGKNDPSGARVASVGNKFGKSTAAPSSTGCQKMAQAVWDHADEIDISKALENFIANEFEDRIIGTLSSKAAKAFGKANLGLGNNSPRGPGWGPAL